MHTIDTVLAPGNYTLWIYDMQGKRFDNMTSCTPISLLFSIVQVNNEENFLSCQAERLPASFNAPGFLDASGYMHYREHVFLDLSFRDINSTVRFIALYIL